MIGYATVGTNDLEKAVVFYMATWSSLWQIQVSPGRLRVAGNSASTRSMTSRQSTMSLM